VGDKGGEASTLTNIGLSTAPPTAPKALEFLQQALPLRRQAGDKVGEANALNNIGLVYLAPSRHRKRWSSSSKPCLYSDKQATRWVKQIPA
jgi:hypothetical protein